MEHYFVAIVLGLIQGLTEFIPVSSSGHLVLAHQFLGSVSETDLAFDAVLQLATIFAVLVYFWNDLLNIAKSVIRLGLGSVSKKFEGTVNKEEKMLIVGIICATIPAVILGLMFEQSIETLFREPWTVALGLLVGSCIMWWAERMYLKRLSQEAKVSITKKEAVVIGLFQSLALIPGMSRSGMTISGGLFLGLDRARATRFSFILSFPIIFGSGLKKFLDLWKGGLLGSIGFDLIIGSVVAFIIGLAAIHFLLKYLARNTLSVFIYYRVVLALVVLGVVFFR